MAGNPSSAPYVSVGRRAQRGGDRLAKLRAHAQDEDWTFARRAVFIHFERCPDGEGFRILKGPGGSRRDHRGQARVETIVAERSPLLENDAERLEKDAPLGLPLRCVLRGQPFPQPLDESGPVAAGIHLDERAGEGRAVVGRRAHSRGRERREELHRTSDEAGERAPDWRKFRRGLAWRSQQSFARALGLATARKRMRSVEGSPRRRTHFPQQRSNVRRSSVVRPRPETRLELGRACIESADVDRARRFAVRVGEIDAEVGRRAGARGLQGPLRR